ncbi:MAG: response regulator transcription factor [Fidelibacterota bacterium]
MKLLIVDDSPLFRDRLAAMLSDLPRVQVVGYADDVESARDAVTRFHPDVVTVDIRLPRGSGIDVLKDIKTRSSGTRVIILTNYPYPQLKRKCLAEGADEFLDKSNDIDRLPGILSSLLENH